MKVAVSIPDHIYTSAERLARHFGKSRSRLFSDALHEYLVKHSPDEVTTAMNRTCADLSKSRGDLAGFISSAARRTLDRSEW